MEFCYHPVYDKWEWSEQSVLWFLYSLLESFSFLKTRDDDLILSNRFVFFFSTRFSEPGRPNNKKHQTIFHPFWIRFKWKAYSKKIRIQLQKVLCTPLFHTPFFSARNSYSISCWGCFRYMDSFFPVRSMLKYIMETQNNLGWKGPKEVIQSNPLLKAGPAMRSDKGAKCSVQSG